MKCENEFTQLICFKSVWVFQDYDFLGQVRKCNFLCVTFRSLEYKAILVGPLRTILGVKIKEMVQRGIFLWVYHDPNDPISTRLNENGCQIQNQRINLPMGTKNLKKSRWRHQRSVTTDDLGWPRKGNKVSKNHGHHLATRAVLGSYFSGWHDSDSWDNPGDSTLTQLNALLFLIDSTPAQLKY